LIRRSNVRVLLLNLGDESASGANLTTANHLVFVHPLVAESQQKWTQQEAQAVGRVRRYGQNREGEGWWCWWWLWLWLNLGSFVWWGVLLTWLVVLLFCCSFVLFFSFCPSVHCGRQH
jgi:hypothetical protein